MKKLLLALIISTFSIASFGQTVHQVCISEVSNAPCSNNAGVFTPPNLTINVGDQIEFTTYFMGISGYNGTNHMIRFNGTSPQDVVLAISSSPLTQATSVTTPAFTTPGTVTMECMNTSHCQNFAQLLEGWPCTGYSVTVNVATNVEAEKVKNNIKVYPNPANGLIHLDLLAVQNDHPKVYLMDVLGQVVKTVENINTNLLVLDVAQYERGSYFVRIESDSYNFSYPVILQ